MVIKGSVAKRDRERLHPTADVEQEAKKEKETEGRKWVVWGQGQKKETQERKGKNENERTEKERDRGGLNGDRK